MFPENRATHLQSFVLSPETPLLGFEPRWRPLVFSESRRRILKTKQSNRRESTRLERLPEAAFVGDTHEFRRPLHHSARCCQSPFLMHLSCEAAVGVALS